MEQKPGGGVLDIGIESLGDGDEPDAVVFQESDIVQAVHQGPAKAIQFPDQQAGDSRSSYPNSRTGAP